MTGNTEDQNWHRSKDSKTLVVEMKGGVVDLNAVQKPEKVQKLRIKFGENITPISIDPISRFESLKELNLLEIIRTDLSIIMQLNHLIALRIFSDDPVDLAFLEGHGSLRELQVNATEISGIDVLPTLPRLRSVNLDRVDTEKLRPLYHANLSRLATHNIDMHGRKRIKQYLKGEFDIQTKWDRKKKSFFRQCKSYHFKLYKFILGNRIVIGIICTIALATVAVADFLFR